MRRIACSTLSAIALAVVAAPAMAEPASVNVTLGTELQDSAEDLGQRDVQEQADRLATIVQRALENDTALDGARIELVLTDLQPNRPTFQQLADRPGLDGIRSRSIGGATIEGQIVTADGRTLPVQYDWYSTSIEDVRGFSTWYDADRAYRRLAANLAAGRYVKR